MITTIKKLKDVISERPTSLILIHGGAAIRMFMKYEDDFFYIYNNKEEEWSKYSLQDLIKTQITLMKCIEKGSLIIE